MYGWKIAIPVAVAVALCLLFPTYSIVLLAIGVIGTVALFIRYVTSSSQHFSLDLYAVADSLPYFTLVIADRIRLRTGPLLMVISQREVKSFVSKRTLIQICADLEEDTPFCFVARPIRTPVRDVVLVQNTRIDGVSFEYSLQKVALDTGLEAASNMPDLFKQWADSAHLADTLLFLQGKTHLPQTIAEFKQALDALGPYTKTRQKDLKSKSSRVEQYRNRNPQRQNTHSHTQDKLQKTGVLKLQQLYFNGRQLCLLAAMRKTEILPSQLPLFIDIVASLSLCLKEFLKYISFKVPI